MTTTSQIKFHPHTGAPIVPVGRRKDGRLIWPIIGAAEGDTGDTGDTAGADAGDTSGADTSGDTADKTTAAGDKTGDADKTTDADKKTFDETYVKKLRDEAAQARTEKQDLRGVLDAINKALNPDAADEKIDPAKLQAQLTDTASAHTDLQREHQVLLSAIDAGADHKRLLDSRSFLAKVAKLDTTADDFASKVNAEIEAAIKEDPKLKSGQASGSSSVDHPGGGSAPRRTESKPMADAVKSTLGF